MPGSPSTAPSESSFVDTNVFLRYLTNDVPEQAAAVERLFGQAAAGQLRLTTNAMVVAELVWTLESFYRLPRDNVASKVIAILNTPGLQVADAALLLQAITDYVHLSLDGPAGAGSGLHLRPPPPLAPPWHRRGDTRRAPATSRLRPEPE